MNRALSILNVAGVLILAALCTAQWRVNRRANLEAFDLAKTNRQLADELANERDQRQKLAEDLNEFRERLTKASAAWKEGDTKIATLEREIQALLAERDQLKSNLVNWTEAVAARDVQLNKANDLLNYATKERDEIVLKFNALAEKHNAVVNDFNEAMRRLAVPRTNTSTAPRENAP